MEQFVLMEAASSGLIMSSDKKFLMKDWLIDNKYKLEAGNICSGVTLASTDQIEQVVDNIYVHNLSFQ